MNPAKHAVDSPELVTQVLREYGAATHATLQRYLPAAEPRRYLYDLIADYPQRGGRRFRPSLCIAVARTFGAPVSAALPTAASIELMHNAMLIHDDIEDESLTRRGQPTLHELAGVPLAINAGDMLALLSIKPLLDNTRALGAEVSLAILEETDRMARESAEGQALELGWRHDNHCDVSEADYLHMVLKKTCWLTTIHPLRMGVLIGTRNRALLDRCTRPGFLLGAAFQIQDDLLNLEGDATAYGKELGGDIYEGKRTLMLIHLLQVCTRAERERVVAMLRTRREQRDPEDIAWVRAAMQARGSLTYARQVAQGLAGAAHCELAQLLHGLPHSRDRQFIQSLPMWVIERN